MKKLSIEEFKEKLKIVHHDIISIVESTYKNTHTKALFFDKDFGSFLAMPYSILQRRGHPNRKRKTIGNLKRLSEIQINQKLKMLCDKLSVKFETYKNNQSYCTFVDEEFGEWNALPCHVFRGKCLHPKKSYELKKQTNLKKYNSENPMGNLQIALKCARSSNNSYILFHWKTNEEIVCVGSYDKKTVEWLNQNKIEFEWQSKTFETPLLTKNRTKKNLSSRLFFNK